MFVGAVGRLEEAAREAVAAFRAESVPAVLVESMVSRLAAVKHMVGGLEAELAALGVDAGVWRRSGHASPGEWLAAKTGSSPGAARGRLALGEALASLPATREKLASGGVSVEQAEAVASAASVNPSAEAGLLEAAGRESLSELKDRAAKVRAAAEDAEERGRRQQRLRRVRKGGDREGMLTTFGAHTPADGALLWTAIDLRTEELFDAARRAGLREPREAYAADALRDIAAEFLAARGRKATAGEQTNENAEGDGGDGVKLRRLSLGSLAKVIVRIDHKVLATGVVGDGDVCEIVGYGPIPVSVARELMQDAFIAAVLTDGTDIQRVVHLGRRPTALQATALQDLYQTCVVAGCGRTRRLETDHRVDWATTKHTTIGELERLCSSHHALKTQGWTLTKHDGGSGYRLESPAGVGVAGVGHERQPRAG